MIFFCVYKVYLLSVWVLYRSSTFSTNIYASTPNFWPFLKYIFVQYKEKMNHNLYVVCMPVYPGIYSVWEPSRNLLPRILPNYCFSLLHISSFFLIVIFYSPLFNFLKFHLWFSFSLTTHFLYCFLLFFPLSGS